MTSHDFGSFFKLFPHPSPGFTKSKTTLNMSSQNLRPPTNVNTHYNFSGYRQLPPRQNSPPTKPTCDKTPSATKPHGDRSPRKSNTTIFFSPFQSPNTLSLFFSLSLSLSPSPFLCHFSDSLSRSFSRSISPSYDIIPGAAQGTYLRGCRNG